MLICARNVKGQKFGSEPAPSSFLAIDGDKRPQPNASQFVERAEWAKRVQAAARTAAANGAVHVLVFVHGFNNDQET